MTSQTHFNDRLDRMARRQDELERQQREANRSVEDLRRNADHEIGNVRRDTDFRLRAVERKVKSFEGFRNFIETAAIVVWGLLVGVLIAILIIDPFGPRQETGQPEERSPSSMNAPPGPPGEQVEPYASSGGTHSPTPPAQIASHWAPAPVGWFPVSSRWPAATGAPVSGLRVPPGSNRIRRLERQYWGTSDHSWTPVLGETTVEQWLTDRGV